MFISHGRDERARLTRRAWFTFKMAKTRRAVVAVVNYQGKVLLGKKNSRSGKYLAGAWHLLAENVEEGESDEDALKRGIMEETGLEIEVSRTIEESVSPTGKPLKIYECFASTDKARAGSDLDALMWVEKYNVPSFCSERVIKLWSDELKKYFES